MALKTTKYFQELKELGMSTRDKQREINVSEVYHLWNHLVQRYNVIYVTEILETYVRDDDLLMILHLGKKTLYKNVKVLEKEMLEYGIPLPIRPPKQTPKTINLEQISDRYIFRRILRGIQSFLPTHIMAFVHSSSPKIRDLFMEYMIEEMKLYDKFLEYGKIKSYEIKPPAYKL
jgi:hypothetical protein